MGAWTYTGDGTQYLVGVPARDLTDADLASLDIDATELEASGIYTPSKNGGAPPVPAPPPAPPVPALHGGVD